MKKIALITGITGQDGSYLTEFLLAKGYEVHGLRRRVSIFNTKRIDHIIDNKNYSDSFFLHYGDMTDSSSIINVIKKTKPHEIYNLAAQSHVHVSFDEPEFTANSDALGVLRVLEAIRILDPAIRFYQASTSELYGKVQEIPQKETTPFYPHSPYAVAKLYAYWITVNYREAYGIFACNGILFNHESPIRGGTFITKKIISGLVNIKYSKQKKIYVGNLYSKRDWGHASDYVKAMWLMLQQKKPDDFVIATGNSYTVKKFIELTAKKLDMTITWKGKDLLEKCYWNKKCIIEVKKKYFRPTEVNYLKGNATKARKLMDWSPKHDIHSLIDDMINYEINLVKN